MTLQIFGHGKAGEIILHDERSDGSAILLVCKEFGAPVNSVAQPVAGPRPGDETEEMGVGMASSTDGGIFPMLNENGRAGRKFKLNLDTTAMPAGLLRFGMRRFTQRALQAVDEGHREVELSMQNAHEWGWQAAPTDADGDGDAGIGSVPEPEPPGRAARKRAPDSRLD